MGTANIDFAIITAPRKVPTIDYSIKSFRTYLDNYLTIFSEPGEVHIDTSKVNLLVNRDKLGALRNYDQALKWLLKYGKKPFVCVLEDDYIYNDTLPLRCDEIAAQPPEFGYYNLFTNANCPKLSTITAPGWNRMDLGWHDAWGVAYVLPRFVAERLLMQTFYIEAFEKTDRNIDAVVSETLKRMGLPMYYHNPSPTCSFGVVSTLGHNCQTDGLNFKL